MKRATTINISGQLFSIDEDAEKSLKHYLEQLAEELIDEQEGSEMLADIEASIAEHLREQAPTQNDPITILMVDKVKETIGHITDDKQSKNKKTAQSSDDSEWRDWLSKPIYKSRHDKVVDGVAAGIAERFEIDAIWLRLGFLALIWLTDGFIILVYIALAIVLKEDPSDTSKRKKRKLTANAVVEQVKVQAEQVKKTASENQASKTFGNIIKRVGIVFAKTARLVVTVLIGWLMILTTAFFSYIAVNLLEPGKNVPFVGTSRGGVFWVLVIAGYFAIMLPLIMLVVSMFNTKHTGLNWLSVSVGIIWIIACSLAISAVTAEHQTIRKWTEENRNSRWIDNQFLRTDAASESDHDYTCVSLVGGCDTSLFQQEK